MKTFFNLTLILFSLNVFSQNQNSEKLNTLIEKGDKFCENKEYDKGIQSYSEALKFNLKLDEIYSKRANAYYSIKNFKKAISDYTLALENNPENPEIIYILRGLSKSLLNPEDKKGACEDFRQAKKIGYDLKEMKGLNNYCKVNDLE